jgi:hypothetical protein
MASGEQRTQRVGRFGRHGIIRTVREAEKQQQKKNRGDWREDAPEPPKLGVVLRRQDRISLIKEITMPRRKSVIYTPVGMVLDFKI